MTQVGVNRRIERAGVNALRALLEDHDHIVHEIDGASDFGEDLRVEFTSNRRRTGNHIAIQVKSGRKYKRTKHYVIPVRKHRTDWTKSKIPVVGVVYDPDERSLYWVNLTQELKSKTDLRPVKVPRENLLTDATMQNFATAVQRHIEFAAKNGTKPVDVHELPNGFVLTNRSGESLYNIRIKSDTDDTEIYEPSSYAVITREHIDELEPFDAVVVGYRYSDRTWVSGGPAIRVTGQTHNGTKFDEYFGYFFP